MDSFEATKLVLSRIQSLERDHASKILGFLLLHDNGEQEIIRLALGPESLLHSAILKAKTSFGLVSSPSNQPTRPTSLKIPSSSRTIINGLEIPSPSSVPSHCNDGEQLLLLDDSRFRDQLAFLNDSKAEEAAVDFPLHRRSFSVPGGCFGSDPDVNSGLGWRPCSYFARGFCKNGSTCSFLHTGSSELASSLPHDKCLNLFLHEQNESQRSPRMARDELHRLGRLRLDRSELYGVNASSRQIYLTFPADSTFREEDVSNYFSIYGPVQDVRIPYQQKRMFGFVTFLYPETVKLILAKGNPHFVCDSRVLVKPYKEKAKVQEKKQQQQQQQLCSSPTGIDSRESLDLYLGTRMFYNNPEILLRRKLEEQADLQQAIELQSRRLLNLQLMNINNHHHHHHHPETAGFSAGSPIPSPTFSPSPRNHSLIFPVDGIDQEVFPEGSGCSKVGFFAKAVADDSHKYGLEGSCNKDEQFTTEENDLLESLEHNLPDNLFASPKKAAAGDYPTLFSTKCLEVDDKSTSPVAYFPDNSASFNSSTGVVAVAPPKSCIPQLPRSIGEHIQRERVPLAVQLIPYPQICRQDPQQDHHRHLIPYYYSQLKTQ